MSQALNHNLQNTLQVIILAVNRGNENPDIKYSEELYKEASKRLTRAYVIMIAFIFVFFFGAFLPYLDLQHQKESSLSDSILEDLARLSSLTLQQEDISKAIQNHFDAPSLAAINDYQRLDDYFRRLELVRSEAIASANNLSINQLEMLVPTFFVCNQKFHANMSDWVACNAKFVSDGTNKKIIDRYHPIVRQIRPLVTKASENLNEFSQIADPLVSENNQEIISKLPSTVKPESWKASISNSLGLIRTLEANSRSVLYFIGDKSAQSFAWEVLRNPSSFRLAYTDDHRIEFNNILNLLNQSKNDIRNAMQALSERFEEVEVPILGKVPLGLTNAVMIYPAAVGFGFLICSYYLDQTITKRKIFQQKSRRPLDRDLYPLWFDPLEEKKWIQYGRLILFILLPLLILFVISYLLYSSPIKAGLIFGIAEQSILVISLIAGYILTAIGIIILIRRG